jgi:hypothetical protein
VKIRRGQRVHASDGEIGKVRGLVVDPDDDSVTHVLLDVHNAAERHNATSVRL